MALRDDAERLATIIRDYREGEVPRPDAAHVLKWIGQFPTSVREPLLAETTHVLERTYVDRAAMLGFLRSVAKSRKLAGDDPASFWRGVSFLRLQPAGDSQRDMLALFDTILAELFGFTTADCGASPHTYVYLDDGVFTGGRVRQDLIRWVERDAPAEAKVAVIVIAAHGGGVSYASKMIGQAAAKAKKAITIKWGHQRRFEDERHRTDEADVLRPRRVPPEAVAYAAALGHAPVLRHGDSTGVNGLFSSAAARDLIEQEFLKGGIDVLNRCHYLREKQFMRPLGAMLLETLGFGTMFVTYRNVPNNAPLVLWAGNPWYPLFPRKTNVKS